MPLPSGLRPFKQQAVFRISFFIFAAKSIRYDPKKANKNVSSHTLRHTFATHLLDDGLDIVSIKNLLGHERIETTLIYLQVVQADRRKPFSPLDTLYQTTPQITGDYNCCQIRKQIQSCSCCREAFGIHLNLASGPDSAQWDLPFDEPGKST